MRQAENELLTRVGPGTPAGELLRRYWHPVSIAGELTEEKLIKRVTLLGEKMAGFGQIALLNGAPHPNAAKVFINWMASKEGSEIFARAMTVAPTRNDIDEKSFLPERVIPKPGVKYFDTYDWEFTVTTKEKVRLRMKELMAQ